MSVSETEEKLCVEIDSKSYLTTYKEYIEEFEGTPQNLKFDISSLLHAGEPHSPGSGLSYGYFNGDEMLASRQIGPDIAPEDIFDTPNNKFVQNFLMPR